VIYNRLREHELNLNQREVKLVIILERCSVSNRITLELTWHCIQGPLEAVCPGGNAVTM
jgi:hypothetical protein